MINNPKQLKDRIEALEERLAKIEGVRTLQAGVLSFSLPDEDEAFQDAQNGWKYRYSLQQLQNEMRKGYKYGTDDDMPKTWDALREWVQGVLKESDCPDIW